MHYRSVADLNHAIVAKLHLLPRDLELVVGIPRSGLLAANLVALHLNLPLADLDGYLAGRVHGGGMRLKMREKQTPETLPAKVLIIDDSICTGQALEEAKRRVRAARVDAEVIYACVFATRESALKVEFFFDVCPMPRVFEWNLMHHACLEQSCVDIDGVLCRDPTEEENDDGPRYEVFLASATPLFLPSLPVGYLVTCRLEKYRKLTCTWLARHGVRFQHLIMMDYPDKQARVASGSHARFKAAVYREMDAVLFIESSIGQALEIAERAGRQVFCVETREMIDPSTLAKAKLLARNPRRWFQPGACWLNEFQLALRSKLKLRTRLRKLVAGGSSDKRSK